jgi:hypothetical protein
MICSTDTQYITILLWSLTANFTIYWKPHIFWDVSNLFLFHVSQLHEQHVNHNYVLIHLLSIQSLFLRMTYNTLKNQYDLFYRHKKIYNIIIISLDNFYNMCKMSGLLEPQNLRVSDYKINKQDLDRTCVSNTLIQYEQIPNSTCRDCINSWHFK